MRADLMWLGNGKTIKLLAFMANVVIGAIVPPLLQHTRRICPLRPRLQPFAAIGHLRHDAAFRKNESIHHSLHVRPIAFLQYLHHPIDGLGIQIIERMIALLPQRRSDSPRRIHRPCDAFCRNRWQIAKLLMPANAREKIDAVTAAEFCDLAGHLAIGLLIPVVAVIQAIDLSRDLIEVVPSPVDRQKRFEVRIKPATERICRNAHRLLAEKIAGLQ